MKKKAVVAGHICIDITPAIPKQESDQIKDILSPGRLINVGDADIHTGGCVANTGLAMKLLGADVTLAGKIGKDSFGEMVTSIMEKHGVSEGLIRSDEDSTSYSVVVAIPGVDRIFLHNPGANNTFCVDDLPLGSIDEAALFHFGYPPIMKSMYRDNGRELISLMKLAREHGAATSMDLCAVDPASEAGMADWKSILRETLPYVDIFVPSIEELMFMLERDKYEEIRKRSRETDFTEMIDVEDDIAPLAGKCLDLGARIVVLKCGAPGMYYCTGDRKAIESVSGRLCLDADVWADRCGFKDSYVPDRILSGTGAGDTSVAAFLTAMLEGFAPEKCIQYAVATGALCVGAYDALSGLKSFADIDKKIEEGWRSNHSAKQN